MIRTRFGFTLVEVLIVVVVMAILAAVAIPRFSSSTDDAKRCAGEYDVSALRSAIQHYKLQHNERNPPYDATAHSISVLLNKTTVNGTIDDVAGKYGPYLSEFPENPNTGVSSVKTISNDPAKSSDLTGNSMGGWLYNVSTGNIWLDSDPGYAY